MVGRVGLEPTANGLKGRCSTIELPTQSMKSYLEEPKKSIRHMKEILFKLI